MTEFVFEETERVRKKYDTRDPFELLDAIGAVTHVSWEYPKSGLKGYSTILNRTKYAVINGRLGRTDQRIVAGHEAAHLILHMREILSSPIKALRDFSMFDNSGRVEYEANLFLADFILEDGEVMEYVADDNLDFFSTARALYIPPPLFAFKLFSMMKRGYEVRTPIDLESKFLK